ncbi:uncharacterized protein B0T15DRAFT_576483 [Chaetomium strumarium]|uniref:Azaphilone pigments biosynthesis cluster protein L N-terminal domain-containing protein n=1 Tax=Chaetomium strumarium TaxID=1170767 RepID=A0AAJ0GN44_9PEZI|nr:hypothetical protein B0T15DRAFT_576483 [Chaetomium strumarium]
MDPLSLTASIAGIASFCLQAAVSLDRLSSKFQNASVTITALASQCRAIKTGLSELQTLILQNHSIHSRPDIITTLDSTLTSCLVVLTCFDEMLNKLQAADMQAGAGRSLMSKWKAKARIVWNEDEMKSYLSLLQGQQSAVAFLVQILHMESVDAILEGVKNGKAFLNKQAVEAESLRQVNPHLDIADSILDSRRTARTIFKNGDTLAEGAEFEFDDVVINSKAYRRAMAMARKMAKADADFAAEPQASQQPTKPELMETIAEDTSDKSETALVTNATSPKRASPPNCGESVMVNDRGPIPGDPIYYIDVTRRSLMETRVLFPEDEVALQRHLERSPGYEDDKKRASWVTLISHLQGMERESREWQQRRYERLTPAENLAPVRFGDHTLAVGIRVKTRSWDSMPASIKKPYATTAICHVVEIATMMGVYWKKFDRVMDRYRAQGNGFILTGTNVHELGVMFTFQFYGRVRFGENRVIPVDEVKDLCGGWPPNLAPDEERLALLNLWLGSRRDLFNTMVRIGCNTNIANLFQSKDSNLNHLFPVPFELVGMLVRTLHIRNSAFRMLPNPTPYRWNKELFNLDRMVREYLKRISDYDAYIPQDPQILRLVEEAEMVVRTLELEKSDTPGSSIPLLNALHDVLDKCDVFLSENDRNLVHMVIREHFQELLGLLNDNKNGAGRNAQQRAGPFAEHFDDLMTDSPELREAAFMELYFKLLRHVRQGAVISYVRQRTTQHAPSVHSQDIIHEAKDEAALLSDRADQSQDEYVTTLVSQASAIWCTLILGMISWLLLHDFHPANVQMVGAEVQGMQQTVYIT